MDERSRSVLRRPYGAITAGGFFLAVLAMFPLVENAASETISFQSQGETFKAKSFRPADSQNLAPAVLILHTAGGFSPHEEKVAIELAKAGYATMAPDYTPRMDPVAFFKDEKRVANLKKVILDGFAFFKKQPGVDPDKIALVGYSLGGYFSKYLIGGTPEATGIRAGVLYYGVFDTWDWTKNFQCPVLVFQGDKDKWTGFLPRSKRLVEEARERGKSVELGVYEAAAHQFDVEHMRREYDARATGDSRKRTLEFLKQHLK
jgi:carboxymethylenebutenolidase